MVLLFFQTAATTAFAQDKPKAGDTISGIVCDFFYFANAKAFTP